jgi:chloramphenicol-sensitive protein RarD
VLWVHEHMSAARWAGFTLLWLALGMLSAEALLRSGRSRRQRRAVADLPVGSQ